MPQARECSSSNNAPLRLTSRTAIVCLADTACDLITPHHPCHCLRASCRANRFEACRGLKQSPIMLPTAGAAAAAMPRAEAKSTFSYGSLTNAAIVNNGHTLQVALPVTFTSDVKIAILGASFVSTDRTSCVRTVIDKGRPMKMNSFRKMNFVSMPPYLILPCSLLLLCESGDAS